ncbi:hypothetical protein ACFE04_011008 [Oxalis oulophora]
MASWHSNPLHITYEVLGWTAFVTWSISFYPQVILNFRRKSVVGLNFDFVLLNLTKHSSYLIYNVSLYFSHTVQKQYFKKYGNDQMIPVAANDVAFSIHAVLLTAITLVQIAIYERGTQKLSKIAILIVSVVWLSAAVCFFFALSHHSWLWLVTVFNIIQVCMTVIKYIPQAVMNFMRKSTDGFSIGNILLDFTGGVANYMQMATQSIDQHSWVNFYGNPGKFMLSLISIIFDILFMCQHYVIYPVKKKRVDAEEGQGSRGIQKVSIYAIWIVSAVWLFAAVCFLLAFPSHSWLWLISIFSLIQASMTFIKYIPQAVMNFMRNSTDGFSIGFVLLDFIGGNANCLQMVVQSIDQNSLVNFYGNPGKLMLAFITIVFDVIFILQHYVIYPVEKRQIAQRADADEPLIIKIDQAASSDKCCLRGNQKVSKYAIGIVSAVWLFAAVCFFLALPSQSWLWLVSIFSSIQVFMTVIKYIPQAFMNFMRKSTEGFSIGYVLLDFTGGNANYLQMAMQSLDQRSLVNFYGNPGKLMLSFVSIFFDAIFMLQHCVIYRAPSADEDSKEPLIKPCDQSASSDIV